MNVRLLCNVYVDFGQKKMVTPQSPSFLELLSHEHIRISRCAGSHSEHRYIITKTQFLFLKTVSCPTCFALRTTHCLIP